MAATPISLDDINNRIAALTAALNRVQTVSSGADAITVAQGDWNTDLNTNWQIITFMLVFAMQIGLALYEAGNARRGNPLGILFKNAAATFLTGFMWWFWGWALSFGYQNTGSVNGFIGNADLLLASDTTFPAQQYAFWAFQWAFANLSTHILFGATTERLTLFATYVYSFFYSGFIYPVIAHWIWSQSGWLSPYNSVTTRLGQNGLIDFSGATVVHLCGGVAALAGAWQVGPRKGRYVSEGNNCPICDFQGQSQFLKYLGATILWFGWYGFTCGSSYTLGLARAEVVAKVAINTTLGAGAGGLIMAIISRAQVQPTAAGILAGLVSISGACSVVEPWAAVVIGLVGGALYQVATNVLFALQVDDATGAFPIHGAAGAWGTLAVGIFATQYNTQRSIGSATSYYGFLYGGGANQFGTQVLGVVVVTVWSFFWTAVILVVLKSIGRLRVLDATEEKAIDATLPSEAYVAAYLNLAGPNTIARAEEAGAEEMQEQPAQH